MNTLITYMGLAAALIYHLITDFHKQKESKPIVHWFGAVVVVFISTFVGVLNNIISPEYQWWQFAVYSLCIHFALFDPIWNLLNKEPWYYAGDPNNPKGAWTDKFWRKVPPLAQPLFRFIILFLGYSVYYSWDQIVGR